MRRLLPFLVLGVVFCFAGVLAVNAGNPQSASDQHKAVVPSDLKWSPIFPGVNMAVVSGDPNGTGPYVMRLDWHPTAENVTVLQGDFAIGMGDKFDDASLHDMPVGAFVRMPAEMRHFALSRTDTVVQVHGMGPFKINFVNPADAPKAGSK